MSYNLGMPASGATTLGDILTRHAAARPDAPALRGVRAARGSDGVRGGGDVAFADLDARAWRVAGALRRSGLAAGARIAYLGKDGVESFELLFGSARAGTVLLGINWRLAPPDVRYIVEHGETELLVVHADQLEVARGLADVERLRTIVVVGGALPADVGAAGAEDGEGVRWLDWGAFLDGVTAEPLDHAPDPEDVVVQMYTSGTTGHPKGVMLAHRSFFAVIRSMEAVGDPWIGFGPDDVTLHTLPLFHIGGIWFMVTALDAGCPVVLQEAFVPSQTVQLMQTARVTKIMLVPAMIQMLLAEPSCQTADFAALDCIVYGGSPIPAPLLAAGLERFGCRFAQVYGLTETGNTAVCLRPEDHLDPDGRRLLAAGRPYPGVELKVVDGEGAPLPPGEVGEICLRSPANMVGYWKNADATAATLIDGWIHTGDAGSTDEDGYVYVSDRFKDMIIYAGENIYPAEIESVLCGHPEVVEAAVIGVPDERWGEQVKAVVVRSVGATTSAREILAHARASLATFKVPKSVDFVDALPRTPSGKIQKHVLREPYWQGRERQVN